MCCLEEDKDNQDKLSEKDEMLKSIRCAIEQAEDFKKKHFGESGYGVNLIRKSK